MEDLCARLGFIFDKFYDDKAVQENYYNYLLHRAACQRQGSDKICVTQWNRKTIEKTIEDILSSTSDCSTKYDVKQEDGVNVLVLKRPYRIRPAIYRKVMALEDSYEIVSKAHRLTGHKGYKSVFSILRGEWSFPAEFNHALNAVCNVCKIINQIEVEKTEFKTDIPTKPSLFSCSKWRLKLINLQVEVPYIQQPKYILVFEDEQSQFLILRALRDKSVAEVTIQLTNVFFGFGPPQIITANDPEIKEVMDPALVNIAKVYPPFEATIDYSDEATAITDKAIIDTLKNWIEDAEVSEYEIDCEIGCYVVQKRLNTRLRLLPAKSDSANIKIDKHKVFIPHNRFYKDELSYEDIDLEVIVLGDLSLRDLFYPPVPTLPAPANPPRNIPTKRSLRGGKGTSKRLKPK